MTDAPVPPQSVIDELLAASPDVVVAIDIDGTIVVANPAVHGLFGYEPEALIGRKVAVVVNLAPRKLRGVESNGMIIAASVGPEGRPVLAGFPDEDVEIGARLK